MTHSICTKTVMDDSDPDIVFDENGVSNHYHSAVARLAEKCFRGPDGVPRLNAYVERIKADGKGREYDCILGVSGGVDSTYAAVLAKELGLRPLAIHLDNGWNREAAVYNVEQLLRRLDIDLYTHVVDWREIKALQRALFRASVANVEVVTDHAINALLYQQAYKRGIRWIVTGANLETESILPAAWGYDLRDSRNLRAIYKKFGDGVPLKTYPMASALEFFFYLAVARIKSLQILNYGPYNKREIVQRLSREFGYKPYERKHGESRFTRFFQEYYLPTKFGFDKRKAHFSSLIASGQLSRDEALADLNKPLYQPDDRVIDVEYVTKKLGFSEAEWDEIMQAPLRKATDFENDAWLLTSDTAFMRTLKRFGKGELTVLQAVKQLVWPPRAPTDARS